MQRVRYDWSDLAYACIDIPLGKWKVYFLQGTSLCLDYAVYPKLPLCLQATCAYKHQFGTLLHQCQWVGLDIQQLWSAHNLSPMQDQEDQADDNLWPTEVKLCDWSLEHHFHLRIPLIIFIYSLILIDISVVPSLHWSLRLLRS